MEYKRPGEVIGESAGSAAVKTLGLKWSWGEVAAWCHGAGLESLKGNSPRAEAQVETPAYGIVGCGHEKTMGVTAKGRASVESTQPESTRQAVCAWQCCGGVGAGAAQLFRVQRIMREC